MHPNRIVDDEREEGEADALLKKLTRAESCLWAANVHLTFKLRLHGLCTRRQTMRAYSPSFPSPLEQLHGNWGYRLSCAQAIRALSTLLQNKRGLGFGVESLGFRVHASYCQY